MKRHYKKLLIFLACIFLIHEIVIIADGLVDDPLTETNVAVILGTKVNEDGSLSPKLKARLDRGVKLYNDTLINQVYVSGGLGIEGHYEGTVMANYLKSQGIPENLISIDNSGNNTRSTAVNFKRDFPAENSVIVVSQYFHVTRCKLAFRQVGFQKVIGIHCDHFELRDPYSAFREFFGFYKYLLKY